MTGIFTNDRTPAKFLYSESRAIFLRWTYCGANFWNDHHLNKMPVNCPVRNVRLLWYSFYTRPSLLQGILLVRALAGATKILWLRTYDVANCEAARHQTAPSWDQGGPTHNIGPASFAVGYQREAISENRKPDRGDVKDDCLGSIYTPRTRRILGATTCC